MSSLRLEEIGKAIEREIDRDRLPGAVIAVARQGQLAYYEAFGYLNKQEGVEMPKNAIFSIWSMTKPVVAVGALILHEEGLLALDEPVGTYLPELSGRVVAIGGDPQRTVPARRQPTVQDLMLHTSGWSYNYGDTPLGEMAPEGPSPISSYSSGDDFIQALSRMPLRFHPGSEWDYGVGLDVLGVIIERISGQSLGDFFQERIFDPLDMIDTAINIPRRDVTRHAQVLPVDPLTGASQESHKHTDLEFHCGGGCLASTALDYLSFAQMLVNDGSLNGVRVLGRKTVEYMTADHLGPDVNTERLWALRNKNGYGFGLAVAVRRGSGVSGMMGSPGDFHWGGRNGTYFWVDPEEELAVVFMTASLGDIRPYHRQMIAGLVLQAIDD